ncbi:MAG: AbrB/MazE/SpoVT family DNA-binding domain-containing protein [Patescibacteria group bacterium]
MFHQKSINFYGASTIGEKGQIVIPAKAREKLDIKPGDDFIFFGDGPIIHIIKANEINSVLDKITKKFTEDISGMKEKIKKSSDNLK